MVPKSGTLVPKSRILPSEGDVSRAIGKALQAELGGSHRAAKTVMAWTGVSGRTARLWLQGASSPNGRHLVLLAKNCRSVLVATLLLAGHDLAVIGVELEAVELHLGDMIASVQSLREARR
jgi:hypothetical protein